MGVTEMLLVVVLDDDVAEVDPDPQSDPAVLGRAASRSIIARCTSAPQRTASTTLENSASIPSPVVFTMAGMLADLHLYELAAMHLEALVRAFHRRPSGASSPPHRRRESRRDGGLRVLRTRSDNVLE